MWWNCTPGLGAKLALFWLVLHNLCTLAYSRCLCPLLLIGLPTVTDFALVTLVRRATLTADGTDSMMLENQVDSFGSRESFFSAFEASAIYDAA